MNSDSSSQLPPIAYAVGRLVRRGAHTCLVSGFTLLGVTFSCFFFLFMEFNIDSPSLSFLSYAYPFVLIGAVVTLISGVLFLILCRFAFRYYRQPLQHLTFIRITQRTGTGFGIVLFIGSILAFLLYFLIGYIPGSSWLGFIPILYSGVGALITALMLIFFVAGDWVNKVMKKWMLRSGASQTEIDQLILQIVQTEEDPTTRSKEKDSP